MTDYKMEAAKTALQLIKPGQTIGVGAGSTIANLLSLIAADSKLASSLTFATSSFKTANLVTDHGFRLQGNAHVKHIDIYFDGCDQFDAQLNALKCGGGIHTSEKVMALLADEFILIGDAAKSVEKLDTTYPLVLEVLPTALNLVTKWLDKNIPTAKIVMRISTQKDGAVITEHGNYLLDVYFVEFMPLDKMNNIKMVTGVVEHSLFLGIAGKAIIAGPDGTKILTPR
ncbi:ribose 5-phosphate isomerase A [Mucilaginibacter sp. UR6-11]|uniref:ribose 5-phosphate isomerase A n=1 Tax=Mucilaginibacter sp. UR6-11 TaxID=1435644 RepID=UPI001E4A1E16|nr:ribose 5-phosphate isomerase A [Mucilaginibacter sp. UR6-11]MCC8426527.1 ribose 5-phosphate isomerase A [Mucilaginibacter sp. UR6-11]